MPCDGVAVQVAQVGIDLEARLYANDAERQALAQYLIESGIEEVSEVRATANGLVLAVAGGTLKIQATQITATFSRYSADSANVERALEVAQQYAAELLQADVLEAFKSAGARVSNVRLNEQGALLFAATL